MAKLFKKVLTFICGAVLVCGAFSLPLMTNQNVDVVGKARSSGSFSWDFTTKAKSNSNYTNTWIYDNVVSIYGAANNNAGWAYIRVGGKSSASVKTSTLTSVAASTVPVSYASLQALNTASGSGFTMNSITLEVSTDESFSNVIDTVEGVEVSTNMTFNPNAVSYWDTGVYFRFSFSWSSTATSNRGMDVEKVSFEEHVGNQSLTEFNVNALKNEYYTTDILNESDFAISGNKSDGTLVDSNDYTVQIGLLMDGEFTGRDIVWGETKPTSSDNNIRFSALLPQTAGSDDYAIVDIAITVSEPVINELVINGDFIRKTYVIGEEFDSTGLTVIGNPGNSDITDFVEWSFNPEVATKNMTEIVVTAKYKDANISKTITGLSTYEAYDEELTAQMINLSTSYNAFEYSSTVTGVNYLGNAMKSDNNHNNSIQFNDSTGRGVASSNLTNKIIRSLKIKMNSQTSNDRIISIYGSNSPYTNASETGNLVEKITFNKSQLEYTVYFEQEFSNFSITAPDGAIYIETLIVSWSTTLDPIVDAETFASLIIDDINCINNTADRGEGYVEGLSQEWLTVAQLWNDLSEEAKALFVDSTDNETIKAALAKYDYILSHYGSDDASFPNFMNREVVSATNNIINLTLDTTNNIIIIVSVSVLALTAIGVFVVMYRKRRLSK